MKNNWEAFQINNYVSNEMQWNCESSNLKKGSTVGKKDAYSKAAKKVVYTKYNLFASADHSKILVLIISRILCIE